jgi:hypothetical protein
LGIEANADVTSPASLLRSPAIRLFVDRVGDVQPGFRLTPANGGAVTAICRKLDALPLALELAAPSLKVLSVDDLLRRLDQDTLFSPAGHRDLPERQRTIAATVGWSYESLDMYYQHAFRQLAVMTGPFPVEAFAALIGDGEAPSAKSDAAISVLAHLLDKSLVCRAPSIFTSRVLYRTLETVRAFAARELDAAGERDAASGNLARYCRGEAVAAATGLVGVDQAEWLDRIRDDLDSHRQALAWLIDRRQADAAGDIACGLLWFWVIRGQVLEGLGWYERILDLPVRSPETEMRVLLASAVTHYSAGALAAARAALERSREVARRLDDAAAMLEIECVRGHVEHLSANVDEARSHFARSARTAGPPAWRVGSALTGLGWVALDAGQTADAEQWLDKATSALDQAGPWFMLLVEFLRATLAVRRGEADQAIAIVRSSLARIRLLRDQFAFLYALEPLAAAAALKGKDAWVARILGARAAVADLTDAAVVGQYLRDRLAAIELDCKTRLGIERWEDAFTAGRTISIDALCNDIDLEM